MPSLARPTILERIAMPRSSRTARSPVRILAAAGSALALHALAAWLFAALGPPLALEGLDRSLAQRQAQPGAGSGSRAPDDQPIEIQSLVDELAQPPVRTPEEQKREEEKKRDDEQPGGQVVDVPRPAIEAVPEEARFRGEYDSRVAHETRGHLGRGEAGDPISRAGSSESQLGELRPAAPAASGLPGPQALRRAGGPSQPEPVKRPQGALGQEGSVDQLADDGESARPGAPGPPGAGSLSLRPHAGSGGDAPIDRLGIGQEGGGGKGEHRLATTDEMLNRALVAGPGSPDWLQDIDDGESTALNAKRFKYAPFFNRIKQLVAQQWHPDMVFIRHDPSGNVYGGKDRVTVLRVHLRPDGRLADITMLEASGVAFLDEEAMDAMRRSAPFLNPPPQLVSADGLIHFNFGFVLDMSGHANVKVIRYK